MILKSALARTVPGLTSAEYLADASWSRVPSLNASIAHTLVSESPLHAYTRHPRLGGGRLERAGTKPMNDGTLIHTILLGKGKEIELIDAPDFRTNAARDERDALLAAGKVPMLKHHYAQRAMVAWRLHDKCEALGYHFDATTSEVVIRWVDHSANGDVECRSMLDHVDLERGAIVDLKTSAASVNPRDVARHVVEYGQDIAYAAYTRAVARLVPEFEGRVDMVFLYCELEPPYSVVPCRLDGALRQIGALRWERAVNTWARCLATGEWPGYANGHDVVLEAPAWDVAREIGNETL